MILVNSVNAGEFIYCTSHVSTNEVLSYINQGDGHFHQYAYLIEGNGTLQLTNPATNEVLFFDETESSASTGALLDFTKTNGWGFVTTTKNTPLSMMTFNPLPATRNLNVEIVKGENVRTITNENKRNTVVVIAGNITANDRPVTSLQHVKIFPGKTATITSYVDSVYAIVTSNS